MSSAGAECVSAPTEMKSAPGPCERRQRIERDAARHLDPARAVEQLDRLAHLARRHVVEHHDVDTRARAPRRPARACRTRLRRCAPASARGPGRRPRRCPQPARWLSLISTASESESRWLKPPPARTAAVCSARRPGSVLRVSRMRTSSPTRASRTGASASRRPSSATAGSARRARRARIERIEPCSRPSVVPASTALAVGRRPSRRDAPRRPGGTPRSRPRCRRARPLRARRTRRRPSGLRRCTRVDVMSPSSPRSSASASATSACERRRAADRSRSRGRVQRVAPRAGRRPARSAPCSTNRPTARSTCPGSRRACARHATPRARSRRRRCRATRAAGSGPRTSARRAAGSSSASVAEIARA